MVNAKKINVPDIQAFGFIIEILDNEQKSIQGVGFSVFVEDIEMSMETDKDGLLKIPNPKDKIKITWAGEKSQHQVAGGENDNYAPQDKVISPETEKPLKITLEVEMFDFTKNEEEVMVLLGKGNPDSFEKFEEEESMEKEAWKRIDKQVSQVVLKNDWLEKTIKIQAKRKYVATEYDDGKRSWHQKSKQNTKEGKWPSDVRLGYYEEMSPTEELLSRIYIYSKEKETDYEKKKSEEINPLLNNILILNKEDGTIEYIVDRFVSI